MTEYSYSDFFWFITLLVSILGLLFMALLWGEAEEVEPEPAPTHDTTKTRVIE